MKAYRIDAELGRITTVEVDDYRDILEQIECDVFSVALYLPNGDALFVDDEGLLKSDLQYGFTFNGKGYVGNGLLLGGDAGGDSRDVMSTELEVAQAVEFLDEVTKIGGD